MKINCDCLSGLLELFGCLRVSEDEGTGNMSSSEEQSPFYIPSSSYSHESLGEEHSIRIYHPSYDTISSSSTASDTVSSMPLPFLDYDDERTWKLRWVVWGTDQAFQRVKLQCFDEKQKKCSLEICEESSFKLMDSIVVKQITISVEKSEQVRHISWVMGNKEGTVLIPKKGASPSLTFAAHDQNIRESKASVAGGDVLIPVDMKIGLSSSDSQKITSLYDCFFNHDSQSSIAAQSGIFSPFLLQHIQSSLQSIASSFSKAPCVLRTLSASVVFHDLFKSIDFQKRPNLKPALYRSFVEVKGLIEHGSVKDERVKKYCKSAHTFYNNFLDVDSLSIGHHTVIFLDEGCSLAERKDLLSHSTQDRIFKEIQQIVIQKKRSENSYQQIEFQPTEMKQGSLIIVGREPLISSSISSNKQDADSDMVLGMVAGVSEIAKKYKMQPMFVSSGVSSSSGEVKIKESCAGFISLSTASSPVNIGTARPLVIKNEGALSWEIKSEGTSFKTIE